ncbi:MAG: class I SAM-dependent methyltransferase [Chloroflexota bacterium]
MLSSATLTPLHSPRWRDYTLLDSGEGLKLERFGSYVTVRPEAQAIWSRSLPAAEWSKADAVFKASGEESGGHWDVRRKMADQWEMTYPLQMDPAAEAAAVTLRFSAMTTPGRHLGVFPEAAAAWDFMAQAIRSRPAGARVLNLFGYTGIASLAAAAAGAHVTHVDASKKAVAWAKQNQSLSGLDDKPIRWIVDDALKFALREVRRGATYDGIVLEPPKFGRGPKGEVWEVYRSLPQLMQACRQLLSPQPLFVMLTLYAVRASAIHLQQMLAELTADRGGVIDGGELVTVEQSAGRLLSQAVFARWRSK